MRRLAVVFLFCAPLLIGDVSLANSEQGDYIVLVTVAGVGSVASSPPGIGCSQASGDCSAAYASETTVTLIPHEDEHAEFQGWTFASGSAAQCNGKGPCSFVLTADSSVSAIFVPRQKSANLLPRPDSHRTVKTCRNTGAD